MPIIIGMRLVAREIINGWIDRNGPDGITQLAYKSGVSSSTISKLRGGRIPTKASTRLAICRAIGVSEDELFPVAATTGKETG